MRLFLILILSFINLNLAFAVEIKTPVEEISPIVKREVAEDKFIVRNVSVDEVGANSELARKKAMQDAQQRAFEQMLHRSFEKVDLEKITFSQISRVVRAIEVREEVITNKRYKAIVDVYFQPEQTQFLISNNFLNKEIKRLKVLVIPVFNENGMVKLWQQGNLWYDILQKYNSGEIIAVKVPLGDINDMMNFKIDGLNTVSKDDAAILAKQYGVDKIIVADLHYEYQTVSPEIKFLIYLRELGDIKNHTLIAKSEGFKSDDYSRHLGYLADKMVVNLESGWVGYNNGLDKATRQLFAIKVKDIHDWLDIKTRLASTKLIKSYKVDSFSARYARVTLEFDDVAYKVLEGLKEDGFKISREQDYVILQTR